jgi:hypothetical protein
MIVKVYIDEQFTTYERKESIEINTDNYPELNGMTPEEIIDYLQDNASDMKPTNDNFGDLYEELTSQDVQFSKIKNDSPEINLESYESYDN